MHYNFPRLNHFIPGFDGYRVKTIFLGLLLFLVFSCSKDDGSVPIPEPEPEETLEIILNKAVVLNPSGYAPLSASIAVETSEEVRVRMRIEGKDGADSDVVHDFPETGTALTIPVHGLYAGTDNSVNLTFFDALGNDLGTQLFKIQTQPLLPDLPIITLQEANRQAMAPGMTLVSYFGYQSQMFPMRPFIFDSYGRIRWYLDYRTHPELNTLFYDDGVERLANGNFYFGAGGSDAGASPVNKIFEVDLFGNVVDSWEMPGYGFHHEVFEKPNGNFLVTVNKLGAATIEDHIIEIDRTTKEIINEWDLNESLQNNRTTWTSDVADWIHVNALLYDASDDTIIISGRTQGVVKLTADNQVVWILAPHQGWGLSGNGQDLQQFLLQPIDGDGLPILAPGVLDGTVNHPDFEWPFYQHAPELLPNGDLIVFDNGDNRNFSGSGTYSRGVSFRINQADMTIQQQWQYGKERGGETYSRIVSDVDYLANEDHMLFSPGAVQLGGVAFGKSIEVVYGTGELIFEASIIPPIAFFNLITLHRTERLPLYPQ
jgi:arylsulfate sulfotransferase